MLYIIKVFLRRLSYLSIDCNSVRQFLCGHDRFAFRNWRYRYGYNNTWFYRFTNMPQFISIDLIDTEQIELKCNHPLLIEDKTSKARPLSISNNSSRKFQALTSSLDPADSLAPKYYLDLSLSKKPVVTYKKTKKGHCDLFNVLICLSSLN